MSMELDLTPVIHFIICTTKTQLLFLLLASTIPIGKSLKTVDVLVIIVNTISEFNFETSYKTFHV